MTARTWTTILGRHGEIGVKSPRVRDRFVDQLLENAGESLELRDIQHTAERERGRFYVHTPDPEAALEVLSRTFGVVSASPVEEVPPDVDAVAEAAAEAAEDLLEPGDAFAIRSRRAGDHDFDSMDVAREAGDRVLEAVPEARVDLDDPDHEIHTEVRPGRAFVFTRIVDGPGGLPRGTQGTVVALAETPRDAVAAWTLLKRGSSMELVAADPLDDDLEAALEALARWAPLPLSRVPVAGDEPEAVRTELLAAADERARASDAKGLVAGDRLDEVTDWTPLDALVDRPVFRPLVGFTHHELRDLARTVGLDPAAIEGHRPAEAPVDPPARLPDVALDEARREEVTP